MNALALIFFAAAAGAQEPAGVIDGSLRDAITRAPVAGARIAVHGPAGRSVTAGPGGEFRFDQLPPGDYDLSFQKSGYLDTVRQTVHLKPGPLTESVVVDLTPLGALDGAVLDENGKPLAGVNVTVAGATRVTDKEGRFAFEDIVPGPYTIVVNVPHEVRSRNLMRDSAGDYYGYAAAQYYPGADDPRLAIPVTVPAGARLRNLDLHLRRTLLVEFTGRLLEMSGREPVATAEVALMGAVSGVSDPLWRRHSVGADGGFRFSLIQPGSYTLTVLRPDRTPLPYLVPIEIGKAGGDDVPIVIPPYTSLQAKLVLPDPKLRSVGTVRVSLTHRSGTSVGVEVRPDTPFELENVPPGEYTIAVQSQNQHFRDDNPRRVSVKAIRFGPQNALRQPIKVVENGNPEIEIQLSGDPAGISGKVTGGDPASKTRYIVTVTNTQSHERLGSLAVTMSDFKFPDVAPGEYEVSAWTSAGSLFPPANAKSCDESVRVTVREGAVSTITLRPCP
jgi:hypothetical protein